MRAMSKRHDRSVLQVMEKRCNECLFSKAKIVSDKRRDGILGHCERTGRYFVCHKTKAAMCRGFYDARNPLVAVLGRMLDRIVWVKP